MRDAAVIGGLLSILVLYFFLRDARATFVTGIVIPVSVIGTFMLMYLSDVTLNIMSLGGIALSVGTLVDNSVVILESITKKREAGLGAFEAARSGTSEVAMAVTASTLTSIAVFFPMVFISGIAGQLFRDQALTVTYGHMLSLLVGLTVVPMLVAGRNTTAQCRPLVAPPPGPFRAAARASRCWAHCVVLARVSRASSGLIFAPVRLGDAEILSPARGTLRAAARVVARASRPSDCSRCAALLG